MWSRTAKKFKMNSCLFKTFLPAHIKLKMSGWEVKIRMPFHVSFSSCKMCGFGHLGRCLTTLCSHQVRALYEKRSDCVNWDDVNMCGWKELHETGKKLATHLQSWASFVVVEAASKVKYQDSEKIECFLCTQSLHQSTEKGQGMIWSTVT